MSRPAESGDASAVPPLVDPLRRRLRQIGVPDGALDEAVEAYADAVAAALASGADPAAVLDLALVDVAADFAEPPQDQPEIPEINGPPR